MSDINFILDFQTSNDYPYWEEINEGILKQIPAGDGKAAILDVGAGRGLLGAAIASRGYEVVAIESNPSIATDAENRVNRVLCVDLQDLDSVRLLLAGKQFRTIVFSDILEHLYDPLAILRGYQEFLEPAGKILVSMPNALHWLNRLHFLFGLFHYQMTGTMDRTHIRFFTASTVRKLVKASGCTIEKTDCTPFLVRAFLPLIKKIFSNQKDHTPMMDTPYYKLYNRIIYPVEYWVSRLMPGLFAFRLILVATKARDTK